MNSVTVSMKMSPKRAGALYMKSIKQDKRIAELEKSGNEMAIIIAELRSEVLVLEHQVKRYKRGARRMNNKEILDNAPDGATHVDGNGRWHKLTNTHKGFMLLNNDGDWDYHCPCTDMRALVDIKRIAELEAALESVSEVFGGPKEQGE